MRTRAATACVLAIWSAGTGCTELLGDFTSAAPNDAGSQSDSAGAQASENGEGGDAPDSVAIAPDTKDGALDAGGTSDARAANAIGTGDAAGAADASATSDAGAADAGGTGDANAADASDTGHLDADAQTAGDAGGAGADARVPDATVASDAGSPASDAAGEPTDGEGGPPGPVDSGSDVAGSSCGPTDASDSANCGACGHSCQTGLCSAGLCQPFSVSGPITQPVALAVNETKLIWKEAGGAVLSEPVSGATSGSSFFAGGYAARCPTPTTCQVNITLDSTTAYWPDFVTGPIVQAESLGGTSAYRYGSEVGGGGAYTFVVQDGVNIFASYYFLEAQGGMCPNYGVDYMAITPRSTMTTTWTLSSFCRINQMAVDSANLYWTDLGAPNGSVAPGVYMAAKLGTTSTLVAPAATPVGIALYGGALYWTDNGNGNVMTWRTGGTAAVLSTSTSPTSLAVDSSGVYWIDSGSTVLRAPLTGTANAPQMVATGQTAATVIATNSTSIFWINTGTAANLYADGAVMKLAK